MRYETFDFEDELLPLKLRHDELCREHHSMYMHWHDAVEMLYVTHGELMVISNTSQQQACKGDIVCIHAGNLHLYEPLTPKARYFCIIFPRKALGSSTLYESPLPQVCRDENAKRWFELLLDVLRNERYFYKERSKGYLLLLFARLAELGGEERYADERRLTGIVKSAMAYLDDHYSEPDISVDKVAAAVGISRYRLCHVFKEVTGKTLSDYWQGLRCDYARRKLWNGESVAQAAEKAGFSSQSYFSRVYQRHFGILPSKDKA